MSGNYVSHIIGPNIQNVIQETGNFPLVDYDAGLIDTPGYLDNLENLSNDSLKQYLHPENLANREAFNNSFQYVGSNYFDGSGNQIIPGSNFDLGGYNSPQFANDMIAHLSEKNVDFAHYVSHLDAESNLVSTPEGTSLESVLTTDGSTVSVDPSLDAGSLASQGITSVMAGATLPGIFYGAKNVGGYLKNKNKIKNLKNIKNAGKSLTPAQEKFLEKYTPKSCVKGVGQLVSGLGSNIFFANNIINSGINYYSSNLVTSLLGLKGLLYNSGMFMMGMGGYSILSAINDYRKDRSSKGRSIAKGIFGGLELMAGGLFTYASFAPMTSLIYQGAGLFSISTSGLSGLLAFPFGAIPLGIGLAVGGIIAGITYLYKWYKSRKAKVASPSTPAGLPTSPAPAALPVAPSTTLPAAPTMSPSTGLPTNPAPAPSGLPTIDIHAGYSIDNLKNIYESLNIKNPNLLTILGSSFTKAEAKKINFINQNHKLTDIGAGIQRKIDLEKAKITGTKLTVAEKFELLHLNQDLPWIYSLLKQKIIDGVITI